MFASSAYAAVFQVDDIRIEGLQRVSAGTVFAALPISVGDLVDEPAIRSATRSLFPHRLLFRRYYGSREWRAGDWSSRASSGH